jgi:hypothetical protein
MLSENKIIYNATAKAIFKCVREACALKEKD